MMSSTIRINNPYAADVLKHVYVQDLEDETMGAAHPSGLSDSECDVATTTSMTPRQQPFTGHSPAAEGDEEADMGMPRASTQYYEELAPLVPFYDYQALGDMNLPPIPIQQLAKLFVGQIPYHLNVSQVGWVLYLLSGRPVFHVEKIIKWTENRRACGCFHVWVLPADVDAFLAASHTSLCENDGIWVSTGVNDTQVLRDWCEYLKTNKDARAPLMPYQMVTIERANSDYRRPHGRRSNGGAAAAPRRINGAAMPAMFSGAGACVFPTHAFPVNPYY